MHDRLAPGTGIGCTADFVKMVREKGIEPKAIGVEVISAAIPVSYTHMAKINE